MNELLQSYGLCVLVLSLKMLAISLYQGYFRLRYLAFANAEDAAVFSRNAAAQELPQVQRAARAWLNDLENIPVFFVFGALAVVLHTPVQLTSALFCIFTSARILHTVMYLAGWQPWRTLAFALALLSLVALAALLGAALLR